MRRYRPPSGVHKTAPARSEPGPAPVPGVQDDWQRTAPVAVLFFLGRTVKGLVSNLVNLAAYAAGLIVLVKQHVLLAVLVVGLGLAVLITAAVLKYWFFRFKVEEERIRIRQGVLKKTQLDMRFERIQGVGMEQGPIYRLLDLVTVRFTTAGAAGGEGHLPAVKPAFAAALREQIGSRRSLVEAPAEPHDASVLVRLRTRDLVCVGLTNPRALQFALLGGGVHASAWPGFR